MGFPRYVPVADHALLIEFGAEIDDAVTDRVHALDRALAADPPPGLREAVPAFVSLLVDFDPLETDHAAVARAVEAALARP
ncbi:carboxyltransferase domain-containing protein, partial [Paracoccus sanguinis]